MQFIGSLLQSLGPALAGSIVTLGTLNDCVALLYPWILLPIWSSTADQMVAMLVYAVIESAILLFLRDSSLGPWVMVLAYWQPHIISSNFTTVHWKRADEDLLIGQEKGSSTQKNSLAGQRYWTLLPSVISAAISNATFLLMCRCQASYLAAGFNGGEQIIEASILVMFLFSRMSDYRVWKCARVDAQHHGVSYYSLVVAFLMLHLPRVCLRAVSGVDILASLPADPATLDVTFMGGNPLPKLPEKLQVWMPLISPICSFASVYLVSYYVRQVSAGRRSSQ